MHETTTPAAPRRRSLLAWSALAALAGPCVRPLRASAATGRPAPSAELAVQTMGTYLGPGCFGTKRLESVTAWLGRRPARHSDFLSQDSWSEMVKAANRGAGCWQPAGLPMSIGVPMLPRQGDADLARGAQGAYDMHFTAIAEALVQHQLGQSVVRLGWELNQDWFAWRASRDPAAWVDFWQRIVTTMRAVPGADFRFDWCTAWGRGHVAPDQVYPGDRFVDIIGMDIYNTSWNPMTPVKRWEFKMHSPYGLAWQREFAAQHGKPVSFPEWGTGKRPDGRGGGDDPYFIEHMAQWLASSDLAYHNYWDYGAPDFNARLSGGAMPQAEAAFLRIFGGAAR